MKRHRRLLRENWYRDVWLVVITIILAMFALKALDVSSQARSATRGIQQSRRDSITLTCAILTAVTEAGRAVIDPVGQQDTPFTRNLEKLGYPPLHDRKKLARTAADSYVQAINTRVQKATGRSDLVEPGGRIDCHRFARISGTLPVRR